MADDLQGGESAASGKPAVSFEQAKAVQGAPFFVSPDMAVESQSEPAESGGDKSSSPAPTSPFLADALGEETPPPNLPVVDQSPVVSDQSLSPDDVSELPFQAEKEVTVVGDTGQKNWWRRYRWWVGGVVALTVLSGIGFGVWWRYQAQTVVESIVVGEGTVAEEPPAVAVSTTPEGEPMQPVLHYSLTQPNLLSFDTETVTAEAIKTELLKIALTIKEDSIQEAVEFVIRDQNYNPLAFSRFAYLLGLGLPADLLSTLDEDFSLFLLLDGERPRVGLQVKVKNQVEFATRLVAHEGALPKALEPLFLDMTTAPKTKLAFHSSLYREQAVRYANIDQVLKLSVDYAVRGGVWWIGTSQATLRALLDRP